MGLSVFPNLHSARLEAPGCPLPGLVFPYSYRDVPSCRTAAGAHSGGGGVYPAWGSGGPPPLALEYLLERVECRKITSLLTLMIVIVKVRWLVFSLTHIITRYIFISPFSSSSRKRH